MASALASGRLEAQSGLAGALDRCLACRRCESVCPAGVQYDELIATTRGLLRQRLPPGFLSRIGHWAAVRPIWVRFAGATLRLFQRLGLLTIAKRLSARNTGTLGLALQDMPRLQAPPRRMQDYPPQGRSKGRLGLLLGCVSDQLDRSIADDAIWLLNRQGYCVVVPKGQRCCGSLPFHDGRIDQANALADSNAAAFAQAQVDRVLISATGCSGHAAAHWPEGSLVQDLCEFLAQCPNWSEQTGSKLNPDTPNAWMPVSRPVSRPRGRVFVHQPCSQAFPLRQQGITDSLLRRIPGLEPIAMPMGRGCCGAAGSYFLRQPDWSRRLREDLLAGAELAPGDILVSANIGCAVHLAAGLRSQRLEVSVRHPVNLLADSLRAQ